MPFSPRRSRRGSCGVGVNFNLAPDLDVNSNPMNPVIGVRSFGDDPQSVALFGTKTVEGYKNGGMLCCGKHFPGHGDTAVDSHIGLPCIEKNDGRARSVRAHFVPRGDQDGHSRHNEQPYPLSEH